MLPFQRLKQCQTAMKTLTLCFDRREFTISPSEAVPYAAWPIDALGGPEEGLHRDVGAAQEKKKLLI